jgi:hypothetical protein
MGLKSSKDTVCGVLEETSFPCRCLGAGGGFFFSPLISPIRLVLSSSDAIISSDVRGVSGCGSCTGSNKDCRETEEVSVPLLLSRVGRFGRFREGAAWGTGAGPELRGLVIPLMSMFLKPSTSNDGFVVPSSGRSAADRSGPQCQQMFERILIAPYLFAPPSPLPSHTHTEHSGQRTFTIFHQLPVFSLPRFDGSQRLRERVRRSTAWRQYDRR